MNDVRGNVLSTATRLFARAGFEGTSLQAIAEEVGVSKAAVLHHFPSKEALRVAVLDAMIEHWRGALPKLLLAASASEDRFDRVIGELRRFFAADPDRARLVVREALDRPEEVRALLKTAVRPWLAAIADYIKSGQKHGRHHAAVDAEFYVAHVLMLVINATAAEHVLSAVVEPNGGGRARDISSRYERELIRIARTSLFTGTESNDARAPEAPRRTTRTMRPSKKTKKGS